MAKAKRWLLPVLMILLAAVLAACIISGFAVSASVYTAEDVFSFRGISGYRGQALDGNERSALAVDTGMGGEVFVNGEQSGDFSWELGVEGITAYELKITDAQSGAYLTFDARLSGSRIAVTLRYTEEGKARELSSVTAQGGTVAEYTFSPSDMAARVQFSQGGQDFGMDQSGLADFASYTVALRVTGATEAGVLYIYSLCGYDCVTDPMYDPSVFAPSLYIKSETHALVGQEYVLPIPRTSVLGGGKVDSVSAQVYENGELLEEGAVPDECNSVTFKQSGQAEIRYTAVSEAGARTVRTVSISVLEEGDVFNTFVPDGSCDEVTVGTDTAVGLPYVSNTSSLNVSQERLVPSLVTITDETGSALEGWQQKESAAGQTVRFERAGEYAVTFTDRSGLGNVFSYTITVDDEQVGIDYVELEEFYVYGAEYALQPADLYYKGESKTASVAVFAPDGAEYTDDFTFGMSGVYRLVYSAELGGAERSVTYSLTVLERSDSYFSAPTSSVAFDSAAAGSDGGVVITSSTSEEVVFERVIDLSGATVETEYITTEPNGDETFLQLKNKEDPSGYCLIDLSSHNSSSDSIDFTKIYIRITDLYDEDNYIEIRISEGSQWGTPSGLSFIRARASGQAYGGLAVVNDKYNQPGQEELEVTRDSYNESGGLLVNYNFSATSYDLRLYYDNEEKALFTPTLVQQATLIYDFDDPRFSSNAWGGFTTGEVKVSVILSDLSKTSSIVVNEIGGYDLTSEYQIDTEAPVLTLDEASNVSTYAIIGEPFPVFDAVSTDKNWSEVVVKAYVGGQEVPITDGTFVPEQPTVYTLVYYAVDAFGNRSEQVSVSVRAVPKGQGISIAVQGRETQALLGRTYSLPQYQVSGTSGATTVFCGYRLKGSGTFIPVSSGSIRFEEAGTYEILYKVTDYLSRSAEDLYEVTVVTTDEPMIDETFSFYPMMFAGEAYSYEIPELPALIYTDEGSEQAEESVAIYDGSSLLVTLQPGDVFAPDAALVGRTLTAVYTIAGVSQTYSYDFTVRAFDGNDKSVYFTTDPGVTYSQANLQEEDPFATGSRPVFTMQKDGGFSFDKWLFAENFAVAFYFPQGAASVSSVTVTLRDSLAPEEEVSLMLRRSSSGISASLDGEVWYSCSGSWSSTSGVLVGYSAQTGTFVDGIGSSIGTPVVTTHGQPFTGFSSGKVYFRIDVAGVTGEASLCVTEINNQQMSMAADRVAPELFIQGEYDEYDLGDEVTVYPAVAGDVLHQASVPTVSVYTGSEFSPVYMKDKNGVLLQDVPADRLYTFTVDAYSTYTVAYSCADTSERQNVRTEQVSFIVTDKVCPEASLTQNTLSVSVGTQVDLASMLTARDNITPSDELQVDISVRLNRQREYVDESGKYTFEEEGRYYVDYLVRDGAANIAIATLVVTVA